jgi:uncharacterized coiled-coil protein SlyX
MVELLVSCGEIKQMEIEKKLTEIESRLGSLENQTSHQEERKRGDREVLAQYQSQLLPKLISIREKILSENGNIDEIKGQRDAAVSENIALKKEIEKLNYRITHLVKSLNEEEQKHR